MKTRHLVAAAAFAMPLACAAAAHADDAAAAPAAPAAWADTLKFGAQVEAGIAGNFAAPNNNLNYGQLYTDRANSPVVNQVLLSYGRPVDPKATDYDIGFKVQGIYGTDGRYTHQAYIFDHFTKGQMQPGIMEVSLDAFTPWLTEGGINWQVGIFPTLLGFETIDTSTNPFYSHSYIYNFGLPVNHTGFNAIVHATDALDIYGGVDTGNQTMPGYDNNHSEAFLAGLKYTFSDSLNVLALAHYGAEDPQRFLNSYGKYNANNYYRAYVDAVISYKVSDKLTLTTEINYIKDDFSGLFGKKGAVLAGEAKGIAQYAAYTFSDSVTLNARAELFNDNRGLFVSSFTSSNGAQQYLQGNPNVAFANSAFGFNSTYGEATLGLTFKPTMPDSLSDITTLIRPELRVDRVIGGPARFNNGADKTAVTASVDVVFTY